MSNLINHAKEELERAGFFSEEKDFYGGMTGRTVLELIECFSKQGHSGMSASIVRQLFNVLSDFKTISPLTGDDSEWNEYSENKFQNKRDSAVFKDGKNGKVYYIDAIVFRGDSGINFTGSAKLGEKTITSAQYIKSFPFTPKIFYIDVNDYRYKDKEETIPDKNGDWWEHKISNPEQLKEVFEYYDQLC